MTSSLPDPDALIPFLEDREGFTFAYSGAKGTHDCARFAGAGVKAVHGVDPLASFAGSWSTEVGAARVIQRAGGLDAALDTVMDRIDVTAANRGDVVLLADRTLALVEGASVVGTHSERGLIRAPRSAIKAAWTVRR